MDQPSDEKPVFGEAIRAVMAKRGCELTLGEAQEFARTLINLIELGLLVPVDADGNTTSSPEHGSHQAKISE